MDVLAGRKTRGYTEGEIFISGFPKKQETFNRITGYCEQSDIHSPNMTVYEALVYSAWLRLSPEVDKKTRMVLNLFSSTIKLLLHNDLSTFHKICCMDSTNLRELEQHQLWVAGSVQHNSHYLINKTLEERVC
jgi:ABC-type sugar transport system ATPase subunit